MKKESKFVTKSNSEQYNFVQIGYIKVCSSDKSLKEVALIALDLIDKQQKQILEEQKCLLDYIGSAIN